MNLPTFLWEDIKIHTTHYIYNKKNIPMYTAHTLLYILLYMYFFIKHFENNFPFINYKNFDLIKIKFFYHDTN